MSVCWCFDGNLRLCWCLDCFGCGLTDRMHIVATVSLYTVACWCLDCTGVLTSVSMLVMWLYLCVLLFWPFVFWCFDIVCLHVCVLTICMLVFLHLFVRLFLIAFLYRLFDMTPACTLGFRLAIFTYWCFDTPVTTQTLHAHNILTT